MYLHPSTCVVSNAAHPTVGRFAVHTRPLPVVDLDLRMPFSRVCLLSIYEFTSGRWEVDLEWTSKEGIAMT